MMCNVKDLAVMLQQYFDRQPPLKFGDGDTILDALFWICAEFKKPDEKIGEQIKKLRAYLNLPPGEFDQVFDIVSDLCIIQERAGFVTGIRLGMQLMQACMEQKDT